MTPLPLLTNTEDILIAAGGARALERTYAERRRKRLAEAASLRSKITRGVFWAAFCAICLAGLSDILSFFDVGFVTSWTIPIASWFIIRRTKRIREAAKDIAQTDATARQEISALRRAIEPLFVSLGRSLPRESLGKAIVYQVQSYTTVFIRDTVIAQLLELIPLLDWLPFYLGQVAKLLIDQAADRQKSLKLLPAYRRTLATLDRLEAAHIETLAIYIEASAVALERAQQTTSPQNRLRPRFGLPKIPVFFDGPNQLIPAAAG